MDPFLPGDIPVMVLRYLAANQCEATAFSLVEEIPILKAHIPPKPPQVSNSDYLRHLARSSVNPGLKEMLTDYMNTKFLVEDMLQTVDDMYLSFDGRESLLSKVKTVQEMLKTFSTGNAAVAKPSSSNDSLPVKVVDTVSTNTDEDYECAQCRNIKSLKMTADMSCQTEDYTAVRCGVPEEVPIMFYKTLLNDNGLQQKIAQTINDHRHDAKDGDVFKAGNEFDKFLTDMLKDMQDDGSNAEIAVDNPGQNLLSYPGLGDVDSNLFNDAAMLFGGNLNVSSEGVSEHGVLPRDLTESAGLNKHPPPKNTQELVTPGCSPESSISKGEGEEDLSQDKSAVTPRRSPRKAGKRITPTPLPTTHVNPNPVFNSAVVIETKNVQVGDKTTKVSVKKANIEPPAWEKLKRRSIVPKTPSFQKRPNPVEKVRVIRRCSDIPLTFGSGNEARTETQMQQPSKNQTENLISLSTKKTTVESSAHKRKATPVKLTPEKAKNVDYNFIHIYHENKGPPSTIQANPNSESENSFTNKTPTSTTRPSEREQGTDNINPEKNQYNNGVGFSTTNEEISQSQSEVTPLQLPPPNDPRILSDLKTISPTALQRLIASANRICSTAPTANFINKKKSLSTPRKRKHIRSLIFATPPSLKETTPGSLQANGGTNNRQKRKAPEDLLPSEFKSKKRLSWPESEKKDKDRTSKSQTKIQVTGTCPSESVMLPVEPITSQKGVEAEKRLSLGDNLLSSSSDLPTEPLSAPSAAPKSSIAMPTILEESLSMAAAGSEEERNPAQSTITLYGCGVDDSENYDSRIMTSHSHKDHLVASSQVPSVSASSVIVPLALNAASIQASRPTPANVIENVDGRRRSTRSKQKEIQKETNEYPPKRIPTRPIRNCRPSKTPSPVGAGSLNSVPAFRDISATEPEEENPKKGRKGKAKQTLPKKPKITFSSKDLFGDTPLKSKKGKDSSPSKLPPDVLAAQAVASQAVPLGIPRRSPRKHFSDLGSTDISPSNLAVSKVSSEGSRAPIESASISTGFQGLQPLITLQTENSISIPFSIVPAPIGFPDPTPIKNFAETGFLNISDLRFRSPLITPLKSIPPTPLNETQFTLPPTPRMIEDQDSNSNSNSAHSLKHLYDGCLYPVNILTSTPMKSGVPRTPGRTSSSSNSRSPIGSDKLQHEEGNKLKEHGQPQPPHIICPPTFAPAVTPAQTLVNSIPSITINPTSTREKLILGLTSVATDEKSDGEISSSDDEVNGKQKNTPCNPKSNSVLPSKPLQDTINELPKSHPVSVVVQPQPRQTQASAGSVSIKYPPVSHPFASNHTNNKQMQEIDFRVSGRGKKLTFSEQETLVSLLHMGGHTTGLHHVHVIQTDKKENPPRLPPTSSTIASNPQPVQQKQIDEQPTAPVMAHNLLQNKNVGDLIKYIRRRTQQPPNNN